MAASTRPLTLGEILDHTVQIYRRNFLLLVGIAAPAAALIVLISGSVILFFSSRVFAIAATQAGQTGVAPDFGQESLMIGLVSILFLLIGLPLMLGVFSMSLAALNRAASEINQGRAITIRASYGYAFRHFWRHVGVLFQQSLFAGVVPYFVFTAIVVVGVILGALASNSGIGPVIRPLLVIAVFVLVIALIVVCILIWLRLSLAYPVCVAEDQAAWGSLKRSNLLSKGTRGRIFVMFLLVTVLTIVVTLMLAIPIDIVLALTMRKSMVAQGPPVAYLMLVQVANLASGFLVRIFVMPIYTTALVLFYVDQRTRLEGYDIEQLMAGAGYSELPPPAAPAAFPPPAPSFTPEFPAPEIQPSPIPSSIPSSIQDQPDNPGPLPESNPEENQA